MAPETIFLSIKIPNTMMALEKTTKTMIAPKIALEIIRALETMRAPESIQFCYNWHETHFWHVLTIMLKYLDELKIMEKYFRVYFTQ